MRRRIRALPTLSLLVASLGPVPRSSAEGALVVLRLTDAEGHGLAQRELVAQCGRASWRVNTDSSGRAVLAGVPRCALSVEPVSPDPAATLRVIRFDSPALAVQEAELARELPSSGNVWSLLETAEPAAILDRIDGAGLHLAEPGRLSMRGSSWTQSTVAFDGGDLTDPLRGGTPLLDPDPGALDRIEIVSALAPVEQAGPGVAIALVPRGAARAWQGSVAAGATGEGLQSEPPAGRAPEVARFGSLGEASVTASGPLGARSSLLLAARAARLERFERDDPAALDARLVSGTAQLLYQPDDGQTLRLVAAAQSLRRPFAGRPLYFGDPPSEDANAIGAQAHYSRTRGGAAFSAYAGLWSGRFEPRTQGRETGRTVERVRDGPLPELVFPPRSDRSSASVGARLALAPLRAIGLWHALRLGASAARASAREAPGVDAWIPESVGELPARVWGYSWAGADSQRHVTDLGAWAADEIVLGDRLKLDGGLRLDASHGSAEGAASGISWTTLSPRLSAQLRLLGAGRLVAFGGYGEYRHRLLLAPFAFGDPNGPEALVYRWDDPNGDRRFELAERGVLVARVGPGAKDGALASIDPELRPPRTREFVVGLEASLGGGWLVRLSGFDRRERDLVESVDIGAPISAYSVRYLPDPAGDILGPQDDQLLPVYDRKPESFGLDRYRLTNPAGLGSLHRSLELRLERAVGARFLLRLGGTASMTEAAGANRGFRVTENDQALLGELFDDPNADTHASGRSFFDRAFTLKLAAAYHAPGDFHLGLAARYQDGQPFGRLVVVPDLAQGPEAIPATPRGQITHGGATDAAGRYVVPSGHRFSYTLTVDARVEKDLWLGARRLALFLDAFNLLGTDNEVEEDPVWGEGFRAPTAVQPPRALRLGVRLDF